MVGDMKKGESYPQANKISNLLDGNANTNAVFYINDTIKSKPFVKLDLRDSAFCNSLSIVLAKDTLLQKNVELSYRNDTLSDWKKIKIKSFEAAAGRTYNFNFEKINFRYLKIEFNLVSNVQLKVTDINIYKFITIKSTPEFYFYQTENIPLDRDNISCKAEFNDVNEYIIYQRQAAKKEDLNTTLWKVDSSYFNKPAATTTSRGVGQFLVVLKIKKIGRAHV